MRQGELLLVGVLLVLGQACGAAHGGAISSTPSADVVTASAVLLQPSDLPDTWTPSGGVETIARADLGFSQKCTPGMSGRSYTYGVTRRFGYLVAADGRVHGSVNAFARLTATAADNERFLSEAASPTNVPCLQQDAIYYLEAYAPVGAQLQISGPVTVDSTTPPFALPLAGNYFRLHVPYQWVEGTGVETHDTFRIQQGRTSATFAFDTCCVTPGFEDSELQAVVRVADRIRLYAGS